MISWEETDKYVEHSLSWADGIMGKFKENYGKFSMYTEIYTSFLYIIQKFIQNICFSSKTSVSSGIKKMIYF